MQIRALAIGVALAAAYVAAARLGFAVAFVAEQVTTVWAPTGIAQAALLLWGVRLWPAVWAGAFIANALTAAPIWTAAAIATGNTLEAVSLVWLLRRASFDPAFSRVTDAARFIIFGAVVVTAISATIGVVSLCAAAVQPWDRFASLWWAWWLGDALGALVVAPIILGAARAASPSTDWIRVTALTVVAVIITAIAFGGLVGPLFGRDPLHYVLFPLVIVAAVWFGQPATALVVFSAAVVAIMNTVRGNGPFAAADINDGLIQLQTFMGVLASTALLLAAATAERHTAQRRLSAARAAGETLAHSPSLDSAAPALLRGICESLEWQFGAIWLVGNRDRDQLECTAVWADESPSIDAFKRSTETIAFDRGTGLPGRVWKDGHAVWIEDVGRDGNFSRARGAAQAGLHGGFGFPIRSGDDVLGVIEFFTRRVVARDRDLLDAMSTVGNQVGQFIHRKRLEQASGEERRRLRAILDTALDAVVAMDHRGVITDFNPAAERIFGYRKSDAVGRELADILIPPELREQHRGGLRHYLTTGEGPFLNRRVETRGLHADGHQFAIEVSITTIADDLGPPRFTGFVRDLTERVHAEHERRQAEAALRVSEQQLRDADRRKDEFLAMLAHELRNPLAPIRTGLEVWRLAGDDQAAAGYVRLMMERQVAHMVRLVDDLLDVSRITSGKIHLQKERADLHEMVDAAVDANRAALDAAGLRLEVQLPAGGVDVWVDPTRFVQVISNLLHNAAKFTAAGGVVTVSASVERLVGGSDELRLAVSDTGAGIAPDLLPQVFDLFTQGRPATKGAAAGLGVGLALARRIIELHGGRIDASSAGPGRGSEFIIRVPLVAGDDTSEQRKLTRAMVEESFERRVLVVDDNADAAEMTALLIREMGGEAFTALDGASGLRQAAQIKPDIILLDIGLPDMDGYEVCRRIREKGSRPPPRIVAITGWGQQRDKDRAVAAGFDAHLTKPVDPALLEKVLRDGAARQ